MYMYLPDQVSQLLASWKKTAKLNLPVAIECLSNYLSLHAQFNMQLIKYSQLICVYVTSDATIYCIS